VIQLGLVAELLELSRQPAKPLLQQSLRLAEEDF